MWKAAVAAAAFACGVQAACSPYVFSENVQALSTKMASIDASYQDSAQKIVAERHLTNRILWMHERPVLLTGPGCDLDAAGSLPCDLMAKGAPVPTVHIVPKPEPIAPTASVCETMTDLPTAPTTNSEKYASPLQRADLLRALDNYTAALAAITKAQDRADFDNAAAEVSAAVGALAQSAPGPYGTAAAPVAKASTNAALWLVGQDLDYRRLPEPGSAHSRAQYALGSGGSCKLALLPSYIVPVCPMTVECCALCGTPPCARAGTPAATRIIVATVMALIMHCTPLAAKALALPGVASVVYWQPRWRKRLERHYPTRCGYT
jgi:hypothetical protein